MKMTDIHGKPIVGNRRAVTDQMHDEGLDKIDLEELRLLDEIDPDWDETWNDDDWEWYWFEEPWECLHGPIKCSLCCKQDSYEDDGD